MPPPENGARIDQLPHDSVVDAELSQSVGVQQVGA